MSWTWHVGLRRSSLLGTCAAPRCPTQGGSAQPHIPASAALASWRTRATPRRLAPQISADSAMCAGDQQTLAEKKLWRCVMPLNSRAVSQNVQEEGLGSLGCCLVEGDPEQRNRER